MLLVLIRVDKITNNFEEQSNWVDGYKCLPCIPMIQIIQEDSCNQSLHWIFSFYEFYNVLNKKESLQRLF